jgi:hypothetical protein
MLICAATAFGRTSDFREYVSASSSFPFSSNDLPSLKLAQKSDGCARYTRDRKLVASPPETCNRFPSATTSGTDCSGAALRANSASAAGFPDAAGSRTRSRHRSGSLRLANASGLDYGVEPFDGFMADVLAEGTRVRVETDQRPRDYSTFLYADMTPDATRCDN